MNCIVNQYILLDGRSKNRASNDRNFVVSFKKKEIFSNFFYKNRKNIVNISF